MCQLLETIKLNDGIIHHLEYHQTRMDQARNELFPNVAKIDLACEISIPEQFQSGLFKIRVLYGRSICKIETESYIFRIIRSLKVVHHESIDYHLKYTDRQILQELFAQRDNCDDIIIVKNGFVTDSFAANLVFFDDNKWFTPATPLLKGTKRQYLLDQGIISEKQIRGKEIKSYQKVGLINAMIDFEEMPVVVIERIIF